MQFMLADLNRIKTWSDSVDWNELTKGDSGGAASGYGELLGLGGWRLAQRRWRHGRRKQHGDAEVASADASAQTANQRFHRLIHASAQTEKMRRRVPFGRRCHLHPSNQIISHHRYITSWLQSFITPINDQSTTNHPTVPPIERRLDYRPIFNSRGWNNNRINRTRLAVENATSCSKSNRILKLKRVANSFTRKTRFESFDSTMRARMNENDKRYLTQMNKWIWFDYEHRNDSTAMAVILLYCCTL